MATVELNTALHLLLVLFHFVKCGLFKEFCFLIGQKGDGIPGNVYCKAEGQDNPVMD